MTPEEAINAATINSAYAMVSKTHGTLQREKFPARLLQSPFRQKVYYLRFWV
jgi:hypothetical protein